MNEARKKLSQWFEECRLPECRTRLFSHIFENVAEAIVVTEPTGTVVDVNPRFEEVTGYGRAEVLGKHLRFLNSDRHGPEFYQRIWYSLQTEGQWDGEVWDRRKDGEIFPALLTVSTVLNDDGSPAYYCWIFTDRTFAKETEDEIQRLALHDPLTNLPNRILFVNRLGRAMARARKNRCRGAVLFIDIDDFSKVNSTFGHVLGDELLIHVAASLLRFAGQEDTVARIGADEFILLMENVADNASPRILAETIMKHFAQPYMLRQYDIVLHVSIGIAVFPTDGDDPEELLQHADTAMHRAKAAGKKQYTFFRREMDESAFTRLSLEANLRHALEANEFVLHYQPRVDLHTETVVGMESLIRRQEPDWLVPPSAFIPLAEETGFIRQIGEWTLVQSCKQMRRWLDEGLPELRCSVNVTAPQFENPGFVKQVKDVLSRTGLPARCLELEITERTVMENVEDMIATLKALQAMDIEISIDDFGTGYSSLSYLRRLPINTLKIDYSFVHDIPGDADAVFVIEAVIGLARPLKLKTLAEGVERKEQLAFLQQRGCDEIQGYYFSRPLPPERFKKFILAGKVMPGIEG